MDGRTLPRESLVGATLDGRYRLNEYRWGTAGGASYSATGEDGSVYRISLVFDGDAAGATTALADLQHPHLETTLEAAHDPEHDASFLVSKPGGGQRALDLVEQHGALEPVTAVRVALQACRGLMAAHRVAVPHGNLTLARLGVVPDGDELLVQVSDFALGAPGASEAGDLAAMGRVVYQLLSGNAPDETPRHLQDLAPWIAPGLAVCVHGVLDANQQRFASLEAFASVLRAYSKDDELLTPADLGGVSEATRAKLEPRADLTTTLSAYSHASGDDDRDSELVGKKLGGRYTVQRLIGRGGMGAVYEVSSDQGERLAAKVVLEGVSSKHKNSLERFAIEAKSAVGMRGAHVVKTFETGTDEALGVPYIIMELLEGKDLFRLWKEASPLPPKVAARLILQAAYGIAAAHERGVIHRDIKPANLFLQIDEMTGLVNVKVCDFGIAKRTQFAAYESSYFELTRTGRMLGSPLYMSPEQARSAKHVDQRTDVFSLSIVLWEALSGQRLWGTRPSLGDLVMAICKSPIPRLASVAPWVPLELAEIVHRGLERDLERRYASMREMATALERFTGGAAVKARDLAPLSEEVRASMSDARAPENALLEPEPVISEPQPARDPHRLRLVAWSLAVLFVALAGLLAILL